MLLITMGRMLSGKRKILNKAKDTKAFFASRTFFSSTVTKTAKVDRATCKQSKVLNGGGATAAQPLEEVRIQSRQTPPQGLKWQKPKGDGKAVGAEAALLNHKNRPERWMISFSNTWPLCKYSWYAGNAGVHSQTYKITAQLVEGSPSMHEALS